MRIRRASNPIFCQIWIWQKNHGKYLKTDATEAEAQRQWAEAVEQIRGYASGQRVRKLIRDTQLHLIIMQVKGYETLKILKIEN